MNTQIRLANPKDIELYTNLLQRTYEDAYVEESIGLTKKCFSKEIFESEDTQNYLKSNLKVTDNQKTWLAFIDEELVGSITIERKGNECELRGFYVAKEYQGHGIGKRLWKNALDYSQFNDIVLDIYSHNKKSIEIYKQWGFIIDKGKGKFYRHWTEWPNDVKAQCLYMRLKKER